MSADARVSETALVPGRATPTGGAGGAPTLRDVIDRWHAAHPDFVAVLPCAAPLSPDPDARTRRWAAEARRLRIPLDEYLEHVHAEQRYCKSHRDWHLATAFSSGDTRSERACKSWRNERQRAARARTA